MLRCRCLLFLCSSHSLLFVWRGRNFGKTICLFHFIHLSWCLIVHSQHTHYNSKHMCGMGQLLSFFLSSLHFNLKCQIEWVYEWMSVCVCVLEPCMSSSIEVIACVLQQLLLLFVYAFLQGKTIDHLFFRQISLPLLYSFDDYVMMCAFRVYGMHMCVCECVRVCRNICLFDVLSSAEHIVYAISRI